MSINEPLNGRDSVAVVRSSPAAVKSVANDRSSNYTAMADVDQAAVSGDRIPFTYLFCGVLAILLVALPLAIYGDYRRNHQNSPTNNTNSNMTSLASTAATCDQTACVHVVFSNHLDVGFNANGHGYLAANAIDLYMRTYFLAAVNTANEMRAAGSDRFIWMTQSWLVSLYFDCPPNMGFYCPNATEQAVVEAAIKRGDINWHAFPFNSEAELHSVDLLEFGIEMSQELSDRFGVPRPTTISQRDVPGTTVAVIPILKRMGVKAMSIGANGFPVGVNVESVSLWVDKRTNESIYFLFHPFGYGGTGVSDAVIVKGFNQILIMAWVTDNGGPLTSADEVNSLLASVRQEFPAYTVLASSFDNYINFLDAAVQKGQVTLPTHTSEQGDTWIYGAASDPVKMAKHRALMRLRTFCINERTCDSTSPQFKNFSRLLLKGAEHTWGGDMKGVTNGSPYNNHTTYFNWTNNALQYGLNRKQADLNILIASWIEQRLWAIDYALQALPEKHPIVTLAAEEFAALNPVPPRLDGYSRVNDPFQQFSIGNNVIAFTPNGEINLLASADGSRTYASNTSRLGTLLYKSYTSADYDRFLREYGSCTVDQCWWAAYDYGKALLDAFVPNIQSMSVIPTMTDLYVRASSDANIQSFALRLNFNDMNCRINYGCPSVAWVTIDTALNGAQLDFTLVWQNKTATRIPESIYYQFDPILPKNQRSFLVEKLFETIIDPNDVFINGSARLHGTMGAAILPNWFRVSSLDAPVLTLGLDYPAVTMPSGTLEPSIFPTPLGGTGVITNGVSYSLVNQIWDTNYPQFYPFVSGDENTLFRFRIELL